MPKVKTNRGAAKRFKKGAGGRGAGQGAMGSEVVVMRPIGAAVRVVSTALCVCRGRNRFPARCTHRTVNKLTFYLAARYSRREELCAYRADLEARGHLVPARWLLGEHQVHGLEAARDVEADGPVPADQARRFATDDIEDLLASDVLVAFTEEPRTPLASRGGRHTEYGIALGLRRTGALNRRLFVVGPIENVFYALPEVDGRFDDWAGFLAFVDQGTRWRGCAPGWRCSPS